MQQQDYTNQWAELCNCCNKPVNELTDLNLKTINQNLERNNNFLNEFLQAKQPQDMFATQLKLAVETNTRAMEYMQRVFNIMTECCGDVNQCVNQMSGGQGGQSAGSTGSTGNASGTGGRTTRRSGR